MLNAAQWKVMEEQMHSICWMSFYREFNVICKQFQFALLVISTFLHNIILCCNLICMTAGVCVISVLLQFNAQYKASYTTVNNYPKHAPKKTVRHSWNCSSCGSGSRCVSCPKGQLVGVSANTDHSCGDLDKCPGSGFGSQHVLQTCELKNNTKWKRWDEMRLWFL